MTESNYTLACSRSTIADRTTLTTWLTWLTVFGSVARTSHACQSCARTGSFMIGTPYWTSGSGLWLALVLPHVQFVFDRVPLCCENETDAYRF